MQRQVGIYYNEYALKSREDKLREASLTTPPDVDDGAADADASRADADAEAAQGLGVVRLRLSISMLLICVAMRWLSCSLWPAMAIMLLPRWWG